MFPFHDHHPSNEMTWRANESFCSRKDASSRPKASAIKNLWGTEKSLLPNIACDFESRLEEEISLKMYIPNIPNECRREPL